MSGWFQISPLARGLATASVGIALAATLTSCGQVAVVAASIQFSLSTPASIVAKRGSADPTPLLVTVSHLISTPITVPISVALDHPPQGVHADEVTVGIGQSSATLNVFVDNSYAGASTRVLTIKGTALTVNVQKADVSLQITP